MSETVPVAPAETFTDPAGKVFTKSPEQAPAATSAPAAKPASGDDTKVAAPGVEPPAPLIDGKQPEAAKTTEEKPVDPAIALKVEDYKLPEGLPEGITAEDPLTKSFLEGAAEAGLPQEQMAKVLAKMAPIVREQLEAGRRAWTELQTGWQAAVKSDADIGGAKLQETLSRINTGIVRFAGTTTADADAVFEALKVTGAGNHPAIIKVFNNMISKLVEGTPVVGSPAEQNTKSAGATLYNNPTSRVPGQSA